MSIMKYIIIVFGIIILISVIVIVNRVLRTINKFSDLFRRQQLEEEEKPKSISAMTSLYLPQIEKDFPDFNYYEFKNIVNNTLCSAFLAIDAQDKSLLVQSSLRLIETIELEIENDKNSNVVRHYQDIEIHQTEISKYTNQNGRCIITLQSAVGYRHWALKNGVLFIGNSEYKKQTRYDSELIYIQNQDELLDFSGNFTSNNCPNCGGAISSLGEKVCEYCGSAVQEIHLKVWSLDNYDEVE